MRTDEIRSSYLAHFESRGHRVVPSAPLIPHDDPSIMFTVAGMVQFKDALTGRETLPYTRATSCQRCVRAGGKHNDLENVGYTTRHHTFFEMMGNFSFGDYFKEEAIDWAWEYCRDVLRLDKERLWFTVHPSDSEAHEFWTKKIGIDSARVIDHEENFWAMGDTGPCGPCSEIFFDQGASVPGGPPGSPQEDGDRYLEIWNLVFPQFDRQPDGTLEPLPNPGVDTGAGLERIASVMQGVHSNYQTDLFTPIFDVLGRTLKISDREAVIAVPSCRVIADHIRSCSFLIADGVLPDREGRGYVLRRVIRRALRHGHKLGLDGPFFHALVEPLLSVMGNAYPELSNNAERIQRALLDEEERFGDTLRRGMELLNDSFSSVKNSVLDGEVVFKLYDTFGFPVDLTADICRERDISIDTERFEQLMREQQERARNSGQFNNDTADIVGLEGSVRFVGYESLSGESVISQIFKRTDESLVQSESVSTGESGVLILDKTAFYGEAGGQIGDVGLISSNGSAFQVSNVTRVNEQFLHHGEVTAGSFFEGRKVSYEVNSLHRQNIARNHSATHLLHAALKEVLGSHVHQRGSLVAPNRLRFDFSQDEPLTSEEKQKVEDKVNELVLANQPVVTELTSYDEAIENGAVALFGEKYGNDVRVLTMGAGYSVELCGGTHVDHLGEIGLFKIVSESGIAAGIRRIEAITGRAARQAYLNTERTLDEVSEKLKVNREQLPQRIERLLEDQKNLQRKLETALNSRLRDLGTELADLAVEMHGVNVVISCIEGDSQSMMSSFDDLRQRLSPYIVVLAITEGERCQVVCGVSESISERIAAGKVIKHLASMTEVRGGGKAVMARGGGSATKQQISDAFATLPDWFRSQLSS